MLETANRLSVNAAGGARPIIKTVRTPVPEWAPDDGWIKTSVHVAASERISRSLGHLFRAFT